MRQGLGQVVWQRPACQAAVAEAQVAQRFQAPPRLELACMACLLSAWAAAGLHGAASCRLTGQGRAAIHEQSFHPQCHEGAMHLLCCCKAA